MPLDSPDPPMALTQTPADPVMEKGRGQQANQTAKGEDPGLMTMRGGSGSSKETSRSTATTEARPGQRCRSPRRSRNAASYYALIRRQSAYKRTDLKASRLRGQSRFRSRAFPLREEGTLAPKRGGSLWATAPDPAIYVSRPNPWNTLNLEGSHRSIKRSPL